MPRVLTNESVGAGHQSPSEWRMLTVGSQINPCTISLQQGSKFSNNFLVGLPMPGWLIDASQSKFKKGYYNRWAALQRLHIMPSGINASTDETGTELTYRISNSSRPPMAGGMPPLKSAPLKCLHSENMWIGLFKFRNHFWTPKSALSTNMRSENVKEMTELFWERNE